jgi:hypothetical protein
MLIAGVCLRLAGLTLRQAHLPITHAGLCLQVGVFGTDTAAPCWVFPLNLGPNFPKVMPAAHVDCIGYA